MDVIICDHHTPGDELPDAVAVLDPQRKDCHYPYRWLSGCGVSFKLAQAYSMKHNLPMADLYKLLDLVCVSIASDIVPITGENRILAHFGLLQLNRKPSLGLKTILSFSGIGKDLTINDIVFRIGPKINAAGRVESGNKSVELLIADDETRATEVAASINNFNDQRKKLDFCPILVIPPCRRMKNILPIILDIVDVFSLYYCDFSRYTTFACCLCSKW